MKATKDHISLETAKLLKDCGMESKFLYIYELLSKEEYELILTEEYCTTNQVYPAYTWQEIEDNAELFFGKKLVDDGMFFITGDSKTEAYILHIHKILDYRLDKKYVEADLYFREHNIITQPNANN